MKTQNMMPNSPAILPVLAEHVVKKLAVFHAWWYTPTHILNDLDTSQHTCILHNPPANHLSWLLHTVVTESHLVQPHCVRLPQRTQTPYTCTLYATLNSHLSNLHVVLTFALCLYMWLHTCTHLHVNTVHPKIYTGQITHLRITENYFSHMITRVICMTAIISVQWLPWEKNSTG